MVMNSPRSNKVELVLGTAQLDREYGITAQRGRAKRAAAFALLDTAWELGVRTLDTAPAYGEAESIIGECPHPFAIHTKVERDADAVGSLTRSLQRLRRTSVDVLYVHDVDALRADAGQVLDDLTAAIDAGAVGVSAYDADDLHLARSNLAVSVVQVPGNVLDRRFLDGSNTGLRTFVRSAFLQGTLLADPEDLPPPVRHLEPFVHSFRTACTTSDIEPRVACLAWVRRAPDVEGVLVGAQDTNELQSIVTAWNAAADPTIDLAPLIELRLPKASEIDPRRW